MLKQLGLGVIALSLSAASFAEDVFQEGKHYTVLENPVRTSNVKKVEVVEAFGYPCPHCNAFEPQLKAWKAKASGDVVVKELPVKFGRSWGPYAQAYHTAELMKVLDKTHQLTFDAHHLEQRRLTNKDDFAALYAEVGVDKEKFAKAYDSFAVNMKMRQADVKLSQYGVDAVPMLFVNGKYRITTDAGTYQDMLKVVDYLVEKERALLSAN
ncbi:MAG: thiol:disulfide interchange protein DsbA/DsbL [Pontibacterium sp.]